MDMTEDMEEEDIQDQDHQDAGLVQERDVEGQDRQMIQVNPVN
jgi:hypothetical protein